MRKKKGPCSYNIGVQCDGSDCSRCGWCPSVEERRLSNLRGPDALTAEKADKAYKTYKTVDVYDETTERKVGTLSWPVFIHKEDAYA
jgi:hypothetical protein